MYKYGLGVGKDIQQAKVYLKKSAMQSYGDAQYELGMMYLEGDEGFAKNSEEAKKLMQDAYLNGTPEAKVILDQEHWSVKTDDSKLPQE